MDRLSRASRASYRAVVYEHPRFLEYFHAATPEPELREIRIGSRPARRSGGEGVGGCARSRGSSRGRRRGCCSPSWLGVEEALAQACERGNGGAAAGDVRASGRSSSRRSI